MPRRLMLLFLALVLALWAVPACGKKEKKKDAFESKLAEIQACCDKNQSDWLELRKTCVPQAAALDKTVEGQEKKQARIKKLMHKCLAKKK